MTAVFEAILLAAQAHYGHCRKGTNVPYLVHPLNAAKILIEAGCPEDVVVAAVLHDTVEDTPLRPADIRRRFGEAVVRIVEGASEPDKSLSWEQRKEHTIEFLRSAPEDVLLVSCADKIENLETIGKDLEHAGEDLWKRFRRGREKQAWYYRSVLAVLQERLASGPGLALVSRLEKAVAAVFG